MRFADIMIVHDKVCMQVYTGGSPDCMMDHFSFILLQSLLTAEAVEAAEQPGWSGTERFGRDDDVTGSEITGPHASHVESSPAEEEQKQNTELLLKWAEILGKYIHHRITVQNCSVNGFNAALRLSVVSSSVLAVPILSVESAPEVHTVGNALATANKSHK
jgi:hypothetical protein